MSHQTDSIRKVLTYQQGEQVIKQGDYGVSIYKVLSGRVQVFRQSEGVEVPLATLGRGDILGEVAFLGGNEGPRSASARALEDTDLELWHPHELAGKYEQIPAVLKAIIDQALHRLKRMNSHMDRLALPRMNGTGKNSPEGSSTWKSKRAFYRKKVHIPCRYSPASHPKDFPFLKGHITDISMSGMCLEAVVKNESVISHGAGESFHIDTVLPNGQDLSVTAEIVSVAKNRAMIRLGMRFRQLDDYRETKKVLGFFLLPSS